MKDVTKYILSCFLLLNSCFCIAQSKVDSLFSLLKKDKQDTSLINHLNALGKELAFSKPDTSIILGNQALLLAEKLEWKKGIANSLGRLGLYHWLKTDYSKALEYFNKALKIDEEMNNKAGIAIRLGNIGIIYWNQGDYPKALDYYLKALKINEELLASQENVEIRKSISTDLDNIGIVYYSQGDYPKALEYYFKALKMAEKLGFKNEIAYDLGNIGIIYHDQANYSKALDYSLKALKIDEGLGNKNGVSRHLSNIGAVYEDQAGHSKNNSTAQYLLFGRASDYYFKALKIAEELGDNRNVAIDLMNIGSLYTKMAKYQEAYNYIYRGFALSDSIGEKDNVKDGYKSLSTLYEKSKTPLHDTIGGNVLTMEQMRLRALHYFKSYLSLRDTLFSEDNKKQLVRKELNYQFEKKEAASKAETDKQAAVTTAESKKQRFVLILVSCILLLVLIFASFILRALRITGKQKKLIEKQQLIMEEKQKEILGSIHYAKRIQTSLLPTTKYIERTLNRLMKGN